MLGGPHQSGTPATRAAGQQRKWPLAQASGLVYYTATSAHATPQQQDAAATDAHPQPATLNSTALHITSAAVPDALLHDVSLCSFHFRLPACACLCLAACAGVTRCRTAPVGLLQWRTWTCTAGQVGHIHAHRPAAGAGWSWHGLWAGNCRALTLLCRQQSPQQLGQALPRAAVAHEFAAHSQLQLQTQATGNASSGTDDSSTCLAHLCVMCLCRCHHHRHC